MKILFLLILTVSILHAEDWTILGKTYQNVTVGQVEPDCVHITYANGIGRIMIADMPPELQKRFSFDPVAAKAASDAKVKAQSDAEAYLASQPKPAEVSVVTIAPASVKPVVDNSLIQSQIASLQEDIEEKNREISRNLADEEHHRITSQNGLREIIAKEQSQLNALRSQLR